MEDNSVRFFEEMRRMLFGFGDSSEPNVDTVRLVESIVLKQLQTIVYEASKYVEGNLLRGEELVFLMRHNKYKMRRFVMYLYNKELKKEAESELREISVAEYPRPKGSLMDFIELIDETGEFTDLTEFDETKHLRKMRADRISIILDEKKYLEYQKARCTSFLRCTQPAMEDKLRLWVDPKKEINFTKSALEVLAYYAHETVAQMVDFLFLVRLDSKRGPDPLNNMKAYCVQQPFSVSEVKEVMRRVYSPQAGKLNFGKKLPDTHYLLAL